MQWVKVSADLSGGSVTRRVDSDQISFGEPCRNVKRMASRHVCRVTGE